LKNPVSRFQSFKSIKDKRKEIENLVNTKNPVLYKGHNLEKYVSSMILLFENLNFNLKPYPEVEFLSDTTYSNELLGYTGHYIFEKSKIIIYTSGRHVKDIMRSFAHELVHHNQFIKGFTLSNVNQMKLNDRMWREKEEFLKYLEDYSYLEGDAYLKGNMLFRTWTNAISQKLIQL